jgi:hypothetical protein
MRWTSGAPAVKRVMAAALLGATAVDLGALAHGGGWDRGLLGVAALVGVGAVGIARRSVLSQVLARGVAWLVLTPMLMGLADTLWHRGHLDAHTVFFATTSAGALLLARPSLHTEAARAEFSPVAYRRIFLAGGVASVMTAVVVGFFAAEQLEWVNRGHGLALAALAAALLASAVGVIRMRAWGVLLGMVTSVVALAAAVFSGNELTAVGLALAAIPGALLASPLLAARLHDRAHSVPRSVGTVPRPSASGARRSLEVPIKESHDAAPPIFARIGVAPEAEGHELAEPVRVAVGQK